MKVEKIRKIINQEFDVPPPEERAALKLFKAGIREEDLFITGLEDTRRMLTQNALRDLERKNVTRLVKGVII